MVGVAFALGTSACCLPSLVQYPSPLISCFGDDSSLEASRKLGNGGRVSSCSTVSREAWPAFSVVISSLVLVAWYMRFELLVGAMPLPSPRVGTAPEEYI